MITKLIDINNKPEKFAKSYFKTVVPEVIPEKTEKSLFSGKSLEDSWSNFYDNYGKFKGILRLSRISFTKNDRALMSYGFACGSKCGGGGIVLMEKESNIWKVMLVFPLWIS